MALPPNLLLMTNPFTIEGHPPSPGAAQLVAQHLLVSPDYFRTLGIRLLSGRAFTNADNQAAQQLIIINETMAGRYFPGQDLAGKRIQTGDYNPQAPFLTVVGVVADVKYDCLRERHDATMYTPFLQGLSVALDVCRHSLITAPGESDGVGPARGWVVGPEPADFAGQDDG